MFQCFRNGDSWTDSHDLWSAPSCSEADQSSLDREAEPLSSGPLGQEHDGGPIGDLAGIAGGGAATLLEGGLQLRQALHGGLGSDAIVVIDEDFLLFAIFCLDYGLVRSNLLLRPSHLVGVGSLHMALVSHFILLLAGDAELGSNIL